MLNKILVVADFLATKESEQANNIRWLIDILRRPLQRATNIEPSEFKSAISEKNGFVRSIFFEKSSIDFDSAEMQFDFDASKVTAASVEYLQEFLDNKSLVIGYELSAPTREVLSRAGITYVDIWLHPVRYLDDVLFALKSNNSDIDSELHRFDTNEDVYYSYADRLRVQNYRGFRRAKLDLHANSALFVGQTLYDKAISLNGKMLSLLDFKERFSTLCDEFDRVYYSRHPFVKSGDEEVLSFIKRFKNVEITDEPTYFLLASDEIRKVVSISSSVVHEAKYFSKNTEFYFRPVINIGGGVNCYSSIYQEFLFPSFWASVLRVVMSVNNVEKTAYFDSKDKIRDMLSFYWGYRNIDKVESLKQTVGNLFEKKNSSVDGRQVTTLADWRSAIDQASVVSFDIFDTLISRKYYFPTDVFTFMEPSARRVTNGKVKNFRGNRLLAESKCRQLQKDATQQQEVTTSEIYLELQKLYNLTDDERNALMQLELREEYKACVKRDAGRKIFMYAQKLGKEIIAISDMTHSHSFICSLLEKNGYNGITKVYVSSEYRLRKHEGDLFDFVIKDLRISAGDLVHIGDNPHGDVKSPKEKGIASIHIPRASTNLEASGGYTPFIQDLKKSKTEFDSVLFSLIARSYFDEKKTVIKAKTLFDGVAFNLGFAGLGPVITGFASWVYKEARKAGITDIYFLARDGLIVKKVFDILFSDSDYLPRTHYIYASRRSARVSTIFCRADVLDLANKHIYATTIGQYLWSRFGLKLGTVSLELYNEFGFSNENHPIGAKTPKESVISLVESLLDRILCAAEEERSFYAKYLHSHGFMGASHCAVVDIGYAGSMQAALSRISGKEILGLYFATFSSARNEAVDTDSLKGYVTHLSEPDGSQHGIQTHRFIYESLFCAPHESFVCMQSNGDKLEPIFDIGDQDSLRHSLITAVHGGVEAFAYNLKVENPQPETLDITATSATRVLDYYLNSPTIDDALILEGLRFHDPVAPNLDRFVVPMRENRNNANVERIAIWPEGLRAIRRMKGGATTSTSNLNATTSQSKVNNIQKPQSGNTSNAREQELEAPKKITLKSRNIIARVIHPFESRIILRTCTPKKVHKYIRDRKKFFEDAKKPLVRAYGKYSSSFFS